ncbi:MAG: GNAT family N-acetyltransferase [Caldimonas sp.]
MCSGFDPALLARIEDAGINASAPAQQRWIDGWLVRYSPGKAKRTRCIQAVASGRMTVADKLAHCLPIYAAAHLRPYVRITPFSLPEGLDDALEAAGMERVDDTRVMVAREIATVLAANAGKLQERDATDAIDAAGFVDWIGAARGASAEERRAHLDLVERSPVPHHALLLRDGAGTAVAGGQVVVEADIAGIYSVFTVESARGRGHAGAVCLALLRCAAAKGARVAYLQVDAVNTGARKVYHRLGFADGYAYHYRTPPAG